MMENKNQQHFFLVFFTPNNTDKIFHAKLWWNNFSQWLLANLFTHFYHNFGRPFLMVRPFLIEEYRA